MWWSPIELKHLSEKPCPKGLDRAVRVIAAGRIPFSLRQKLEMVLNRKTEEALGLAIPPSIMLRADEVIE
jgi:putative ABC transport system substrate-binding protein